MTNPTPERVEAGQVWRCELAQHEIRVVDTKTESGLFLLKTDA